MKLIGAALGRTGTMSISRALNELGVGPCYHMTEVIKHPKHVYVWLDAAAGKEVDWAEFLTGYESGVDYPFANYALELLEIYPEAKVLLVVRDFDRWYESTYETIYKGLSLPRWLERAVPILNAFKRMVDISVWENLFEGRFEDRDFAIGRYKQYIETVRAAVPAERLLEYSVKEGWAPLCEFLDVPIPEKPFPRVNDRKMIKRVYFLNRVFSWVLTAGIVAGLLYWILF